MAEKRTTSEENFKAQFGHYPQRVEFPEPDPSTAGAVNRLFALHHESLTGGWPKPPLRSVEGGAHGNQS